MTPLLCVLVSRPGPGVPLEETDGLPGGGELRRAREAHDPGAYDDGVDL